MSFLDFSLKLSRLYLTVVLPGLSCHFNADIGTVVGVLISGLCLCFSCSSIVWSLVSLEVNFLFLQIWFLAVAVFLENMAAGNPGAVVAGHPVVFLGPPPVERRSMLQLGVGWKCFRCGGSVCCTWFFHC